MEEIIKIIIGSTVFIGLIWWTFGTSKKDKITEERSFEKIMIEKISETNNILIFGILLLIVITIIQGLFFYKIQNFEKEYKKINEKYEEVTNEETENYKKMIMESMKNKNSIMETRIK